MILGYGAGRYDSPEGYLMQQIIYRDPGVNWIRVIKLAFDQVFRHTMRQGVKS